MDCLLPRLGFLLIASAGCSSGPATIDGAADAPEAVEASTPDTGTVVPLDAPVEASLDVARDSAFDVPRDAGPADTGPPSCEERFWRSYVDRNNAGYPDLAGIGHRSFAYIQSQVEALNARGARVTVGGLLSLLVYEGGARIAAYNDRCRENSYVSTAMCWQTPQARYSYQLGMGAIHTSNFYACRDVTWTTRMRTRLMAALTAHGFTPSAADLSSVTREFNTVCPGQPTAVDYYILAVHSVFHVPTDDAGNDLANVGRYPFFTPEVSIDMFFGGIGGNPAALTSDRQAIVVFGGSDTRYRDTAVQDRILDYYLDYRATNCR